MFNTLMIDLISLGYSTRYTRRKVSPGSRLALAQEERRRHVLSANQEYTHLYPRMEAMVSNVATEMSTWIERMAAAEKGP